MIRPLTLLAVATVLAVQPASVEAQWDITRFHKVCIPGSLKPCASVIVQTQWNATTQETLVEMWVRNMQGGTIVDNTGGSFITQIGLTAPSVGTVSNFAVRLEGNVGMTSPGLDPNDYWSLDNQNRGLGGQVTFKATTPNNKNGSIRGCDQPVGNTAEYFITCDSQGHTGAVVFSFTSDQQFATAPEIALKYQSIADPLDPNGDISLICRTAGGCSVTPEPSTWVMLLTGMVGLLGMGWVRRKREDTA